MGFLPGFHTVAADADYPHIAIYYDIQFNLHLQLLAATEHARANGVVLKGDIPETTR